MEKKGAQAAPVAATGAAASPPPAAPQAPQALVCHGHSRPIVEISYSPITPDGYFLVSASKDGRPMLRNGETGDWIGTFEGHKGAVWSAVLDAPALRAATASADFSAKVWDALTGDEKHSFEHSHIVRTCDFSQSTRHLLTGGYEKKLRIFDLEKPEADPTVFAGQPGAVKCAKWHDDDKLILATCADMPGVRVLDARSGETVLTVPTAAPCLSLEMSRNGQVLTLADGSIVTFWDRTGGKQLKSFTLPKQANSASLSPVGDTFAAGGDDMWVHVFDYVDGKEIACHKGHHGPVHCVRFAPDGGSCASGSEDGTIRIWRVTHPAAANGDASHGNDSVIRVAAAEDVAKKIEGFNIQS